MGKFMYEIPRKKERKDEIMDADSNGNIDVLAERMYAGDPE